MKKPSILIATLALLPIVAIHSQAQIITSLQFTNSSGTTLASSTVAGVDAVDYWNTATITGTPGSNAGTAVTNSSSSGLVTSTDAASSIGYSVTSYGNKNATETFTGSNAAGNGVLMSNGAATRGVGSSGASAPNPVTLTLTGLKATDTYSFYVYVGTQGGLLGEYSLSLSSGGPTYYSLSSYGGFDASNLSTFQSGSSTTNFEPVADSPSLTLSYQSNYLLFTGITGVTSDKITLTELGEYNGSATFSAAGAGGNGPTVDISGVQIVDTVAVAPEPSEALLMSIGLFAIVMLGRRKRGLNVVRHA
jgi:hypothetical protein